MIRPPFRTRRVPVALLLPAALLVVAAPIARAADQGLIRGEVVRAHNRPLVGAVALGVREGDPPLLELTTTDAFGFFRLRDLPDGSYATAVLRPGYQPFLSRDVVVRGPFPAVLDHVADATDGAWSAPVVIAGPASGEADLAFTVLDDHGAPVPDTRVHLLGLDAVSDPVTTRTGLDGRAGLAVPAGRYRLRLFCVGRLPVEVPEITLPGRALTIRARLLEQPLNYRPEPTEILPEEWPLMPPGAVVSTTLEDVVEAELVAEGEAVAAALVDEGAGDATSTEGDGTGGASPEAASDDDGTSAPPPTAPGGEPPSGPPVPGASGDGGAEAGSGAAGDATADAPPASAPPAGEGAAPSSSGGDDATAEDPGNEGSDGAPAS